MGKGSGGWRRRIVTFGLAAAALLFVAYLVPIRDRCADPGTVAAAPRVPVSRDGNTCILHRPLGDVRLSEAECKALVCDPGLSSTLGRARLDLVALLALVYLAGTFVWAARWRALLRLANAPVSLLSAWRITLESQAGGVLLPGGVAGDALRIASIVGRGAPLATVVASVMLDRAIGLATLAGLAAGLAAAFEPGAIGPAVLVLASIPLGIAAGLAVLRIGPIRRAKILDHRRLAGTVKPILEYLGEPRAPRAILVALAASFVLSAIQLGVIRGLCTALGNEPTVERWVYTGSAITFVLGIIPAVPGGWGTSDAAFVLFLGRAGIAASTAFAVALLYRLDWYLSAAIGAALYATRRQK